MQRRGFLQLMAATAAMSPIQKVWAAGRTRVIVVGAGIMGASIAYHLAKRGAEVTVLEKTAPASGTTKDSFAWLNAGKSPRSYYDYNLAGILGWRRLQLEIGPDLPMQWGGTVRWSMSEATPLAARRKSLVQSQSWGYPTWEIGADEVAKLLPGVMPGPLNYADFAAIEGTVDPVVAVQALVGKAKSFGAKIIYPCEITGLDLSADKIKGVQTTQGKFEADYVILASGNGIPQIAKMAGLDVPLIESIGIMAKTKPLPRLLNRLVSPPGGDLKQNFDGRIVIGTMEGHGAAKSNGEPGAMHLEQAAKFIPAAKGAQLDRVITGYRVMPRDGHPILDRAPKYPNLYIAAQHSAMTCAPIAGQLVASEILDQVSIDLLAPYRLSRFS